MSLINDALKKASQTPASQTPAEIKEPLRVATHTPAPRWPMFVVPPLVAVVFAAGTLLVIRGWQGSRKVSARETITQRSETNSIATASPAPAPPASIAPALAPAASNTGVTNVSAFPSLKVQGIIWQPSRPSVVINGKSLFVGEKIEKAKVVAIDQETVTVVWNGEQRVLTVP